MEYTTTVSDPDLYSHLKDNWPNLNLDEMVTYVNMTYDIDDAIMTLLTWLDLQDSPLRCQEWPFTFSSLQVSSFFVRFYMSLVLIVYTI